MHDPLWFADMTPCEIAPDGAWTWFNGDRLLNLGGGEILAGHVRRDGRVGATHYRAAGDLQQTSLLGAQADAEPDDHNNPGLCLLPDGRILAVWARHGTDKLMRWRHGSRDPATGLLVWSDETAQQVPAAHCYSNLFSLQGQLVNITRS